MSETTSGGWTYADEQAAEEGMPIEQLYDMQEDPCEKTNLQAAHPEKVREMVQKLKQLIADGRSTPGEPQSNDAEIDMWKMMTMPAADRSVLNDVE